MAYSVTAHVQYNTWANGKIVDVLKQLPDETFHSPNNSSFGSIARTALHIWDSQVVWYKRIEGISLERFPSTTFNGTSAEVFQNLLNSSAEIEAFVKRHPERLGDTLHYFNLKGEPNTDTLEDILFHIVNHGTYHRGQIITMLRALNISPLPSTDLIHYLRSLR